MKSGEAFGWLIANLINRHIGTHWWLADGETRTAEEEAELELERRDAPYCPNCCGPCRAWADWFSQNKGLTDSYTRHLPERGWVWMKADGGVDWEWISRNMSKYKCPNCERRSSERQVVDRG